MTNSLKYAATSAGVVALALLVAWPLLDPSGRRGVLLAAAVALPVQILSYAALQRFRGEMNRFLAAWIGGTLFRMVVIAIAAVVVIRTDVAMATPMLLALASFLFGLLLLEPIYFRREQAGTS